MPIITSTPVQLPDLSRDTRSGPSTSTDTGAGHQFIFEYQAPQRLYVVTWSFVTNDYSDIPKARIYKSLDNGATWSAALDEANTPPIYRQRSDIWQAGNTLYVATANASVDVVVTAFDVTTETWGTPSVAGPSVDVSSNEPNFRIVRYNSGRIRIIYNTTTISEGLGCSYTDLVAGVWSAPAVIEAPVAFNLRPMSKLIYDPNTEKVHIISLYIPEPPPSPDAWNLTYRTITEGGTVSSRTTIGQYGFPQTGVVSTAPNVGKCSILSAADLLAVPVTDYRTSPLPTFDRQVAVFIGTPVSSPVWTRVDINTVTLPPNEIDFESYSFVSSNVLYVFWVFTDANTIQKLYWTSTTDGVSWTTPVLYYDATADPNPDVATPNLIHAVGVVALAAGGFSVQVALQAHVTSPDFSDCIGYALAETPSGPSIICDNPPNGTVGTAYSHTFPASGGTPPYTFAITAGILPPGLTLNTSTGVISGTPVAYGTFDFTIQVTDSLAQTASVSCSIVILAPPPPSVLCDNPPSGQIGVDYSHFFPGSSGVPPYTFSISAGALPDGVTLNATTGEVSGTPTLSGTFSFTVRITDSVGQTADVACSILIIGSSSCPDPHDDVRPWISHYPPNA